MILVLGDSTPSPYVAEIATDAALAHWRLGEQAGSVAFDSSGNGRHATYGSPAILGAAGLLPGDTDLAAEFQGNLGGYAEVASATWMDVSVLTVEAWIKPDNVTSTRVIAQRDSTSGTGRCWVFRILSSGRLDFSVWNSVGTGYNPIAPTGTLVAGSTYHVVGVFDGTTATVYVNGVEAASMAVTGTVRSAVVPTRIAAGTSTERFDGILDEVAIYNTALSAARVLAHYVAGTTSTPEVAAPLVGAGSIAAQVVPVGVATAPLAGSGVLTAAVAISTTPYAPAVLADNPELYWRLGETSGTTASDSSGNVHLGTYSAVTLGTTGLLAGDTNKAATFDGSTSQVTSAHQTADAAQSYTIEAWIKTSDAGAGARFIAGWKGTTSANHIAYFYLSDNLPRFAAFRTTSTAFLLESSVSIADGKPHHLVGVVGSSQVHLYVDGVLVDSATTFGTMRNVATGGFRVGRDANGDQQFAGVIDEVAHYTTALSDARVLAHYEAGIDGVLGAFAGSGAFTAIAAQVFARDAALSGTGTLTADVEEAVYIPEVAAPLDGTGALTADVSVLPEVTGELTGSGALSAAIEAAETPVVSGVLAGSGELTATAESVVTPAVVGALSGSGLLSAEILEVEIHVVAAHLTGTGFLSVTVHVVQPSTPTTRWKLRDTATDVEWTMPINPDSMSSPLPRRSLKFGFGWRSDGRVRTFAGPGEAREWEWSGAIRTKEHYDLLVEWAEKSVAIDVTDHLGRTFRVFIVEFNPIDRRSTPNTPWRLRYTMKTRVLERVT